LLKFSDSVLSGGLVSYDLNFGNVLHFVLHFCKCRPSSFSSNKQITYLLTIVILIFPCIAISMHWQITRTALSIIFC